MAANEAQHVRTPTVRQRVVDEDDVGRVPTEQCADGGESRGVADELEPVRLPLERAAEHVGDELVIVDEGDANRPRP